MLDLQPYAALAENRPLQAVVTLQAEEKGAVSPGFTINWLAS
jgi:hypothetical protein